jgi:hypothetical protein
MRGKIMENMKKTTAIALALCLGIALHNPLSATVYDFTNRDANDPNLLHKEYHAAGGKTISVKNESSNNIYLRIGYEACEFTGFKLKPGQTGRVYKSPFCVPFNVSGHFLAENGSVIGDIQNPMFKRRMEELGALEWEVDNDGLRFVSNEGPESTFILGDVKKGVAVYNHTSHRVYIRIGYEACKFDAFYLTAGSPGFAGPRGSYKFINKEVGCVPYIVSGYIYLDGVTPTDLVPYKGKVYGYRPEWRIEMNDKGTATVRLTGQN